MRTILTISVLVIFLFNCQNNSCDCLVDENISISNKNNIRNLEVNWKGFGKEDLRSAKENSYRLFISPSFSIERRIYTLINKDNNPYITVDYYNKDTNRVYYDSLDRKQEKYMVSILEWNKFELLIKQNCYWTMSCESNNKMKTDGILWFFEGYKNKKNICTSENYHFVARESSDSTFFVLCDELLKFANTSRIQQDIINYKVNR